MMFRRPWIALPALAVGALLALLAGAQDTRGAQASLDDLLQADGMTQEEMAVELLRALDGAELAPPDCVTGQEMFDDVPASSLFCPFIEELARRGITEGCDGDNFCPGDPVTRGQMATFVVRALEEAGGCRPAIPGTGEMVEVGGVCIDKYENSLWTQPDGGTRITGPIPCSENGQDCDNIYARSVAGVEPRGDITWFQAQAALANSGKRLPTNAEWQMAVLGTPDPGNSPGSEDCNTNSSGPEATGERANCVSRWGIHDMVGNLREWVADWDEEAAACNNWSPSFGDDRTCIGRGDGDFTSHFPGALIRGGSFFSGSFAGPFAVNGGFRPSFSHSSRGFRGAR